MFINSSVSSSSARSEYWIIAFNILSLTASVLLFRRSRPVVVVSPVEAVECMLSIELV